MHKRAFGIYHALYPLSLVYWAVTAVRNKLFDTGLLHSCRFIVPVICVGNITVGGTGKTPHTEYLVRLLAPLFRTAVLSRGYKRKTKGFVLADGNASAESIGDEPYQMVRKFPGLTVAVDANRREGILRLLRKADVIVLDDAFQHRRVSAGLNILLIDYNRLIWQDALLPAGRLRESAAGKRRADIIIFSKCPAGMGAEEMDELKGRLNPHEGQTVLFSSLRYGRLKPLSGTDAAGRSPDSLGEDDEVLLLTGIASPKALAEMIGGRAGKLVRMDYGDHHDFSHADMENVRAAFERLTEGKRMVITTEKDAARLVGRGDIGDDLKRHIYTLPVEVEFLGDCQNTFNQIIIDYVRENTRDGSLLKGKDAHTA